MVVELIMWNLSRMVRRKLFVYGFLFLLFVQITSYFPLAGIFYTFGYVNPIMFLQIVLYFLSLNPVYERSSLYFLMRSERRRSFWIARVLSTVVRLYGTVVLLLIVNIILITILHGSIFNTSDVYISIIHKLESQGIRNILLIVNLLSLGMISVVLLMDVMHLYFNNTIVSFFIIVALLIISMGSYLVPTEPLSYIIFLVSPFLRMSLLANMKYNTAPIDSMLFLFLLICVGYTLGNLLFTHKELSE